jgi:hypothetical protein
MRANPFIVRCAIIALTLLTIFDSDVRAALLLPGTTIPAASSGSPVGGTVVDSVTSPFSSTAIDGTLVSEVVSGDTSNPFGPGALTFTYKLTMAGSSTDDVTRVTVSSYGTTTTDVTYNPAGGGVAPSDFSRSSSGSVLRFNWDALAIPPASAGALIVVQTNATSWDDTTAAVIDGTSVNVPSLAPMAIPEPGAAAMALVGAGGLLARRHPRK